MVAKLRAAGAIILGKTNLDEYAPAGIARSTLGGQTCNPYDTKRVPAGSSGGSGAAVAANLAICALGTDTAGSVRNPASANALVGMVASPISGLVRTVLKVVKPLGAISPEAGAKTIIYLASSPEVATTSGEYFYECKITTPTAEARNDADARRLWEISEQIAGPL